MQVSGLSGPLIRVPGRIVVIAPAARAQTDNIVTNDITIMKVVTGQAAATVAPFMNPDGRPGYFFSFQCTPTIEGQPGAQGQVLLLLDIGATSGTTTFPVGAVLNSDDGSVQCTVTEDAPASSALAGSPTVAIGSQGDSRAPDPNADLVTGATDRLSAVVRFPYTRTNAVASVTFTNSYAIVTAPTFTG